MTGGVAGGVAELLLAAPHPTLPGQTALVLVAVLGDHPHDHHIDPLLERLLGEGGGGVAGGVLPLLARPAGGGGPRTRVLRGGTCNIDTTATAAQR